MYGREGERIKQKVSVTALVELSFSEYSLLRSNPDGKEKLKKAGTKGLRRTKSGANLSKSSLKKGVYSDSKWMEALHESLWYIVLFSCFFPLLLSLSNTGALKGCETRDRCCLVL